MNTHPNNGILLPHSAFINDPWRLIQQGTNERWKDTEISAINKLAVALADDLKNNNSEIEKPSHLSKAQLIEIAVKKLLSVKETM